MNTGAGGGRLQPGPVCPPQRSEASPRTSCCLPFLHNLWKFVSFLLLSHLYLVSVEQSVLLRVGRFDLKVQQMGLRR